MGKLLAIDGMNIVRRVYEANAETDLVIKAEVALRHSLASFRKLLSMHQPTHVLAAFDFGGPTWRHALYPAYREHRDAMPQALKDGLPDFYAQLAGWGLQAVSVPEVEADDVIATAVLRWLGEGRGEAIVASTDKDLHVLIDAGAMIWDHFRSEWHDEKWVEEKFGVPPAQLAELLALTGDAADGVPGVSKVGVKTAARLLQNYGSIDRIMSGAGILKDAMGERLRKDSAQLEMSRKLVTLKTDVRLGVTWNVLAFDSGQMP
ncbi:MAG TPA: 5'-3' exonuclease H3TH domain-containing protein [Oxalicibacterium sp.]|uniref:5'-3' exonuclease n=1 Tax=Oxalicibacterium sp. TaxID=2766525 RepID=UPI002BF5A5C8|nr:5'-3' exonuclease H3TH domain-containing protein [Oxalicibacterium sp.]HWU97155.1 5'-3' exonuclease H3TH domain-containing protein [Oxalicibacterium sp.]